MPIRLRLTIWNSLVIIGAILLLGGLTYWLEARSLTQEVDDSLRTQARNLQSVYEVRAALPPRARERIMPQPSVFSAPAFHVQILDPNGEVVERTAALGGRRLPVNLGDLDRVAGSEEVFRTVTLDGQDVRTFIAPLTTDDDFLGYVQVARSMEALEDALELLARTIIGAGAVLLLVSLIVAWLLAGAALRPVQRITEAAREIGFSPHLDRRLPAVGTRDEIARLGDTFNGMLDRLENVLNSQRRFVADASHELRTPLTTIRGNLDLLRRSGAIAQPEMQEALEDVRSEAERMSRMVAGLLALARADAGHALAREPVRLDQLVGAVHREAQTLAGDVIVQLGTVEPTEVQGDHDALKQLLLILVENGIKYTAPGGTVTLSLRVERGQAAVQVRDSGCGIAPVDLPHIFERFYRSPAARASGGTGLGLAIAHWIADEHRATISVDSAVNVGTTFTVRLAASPVAEAASDQVPRGDLAPQASALQTRGAVRP
jgi:two-component system, OmpR family, sensor kinase